MSERVEERSIDIHPRSLKNGELLPSFSVPFQKQGMYYHKYEEGKLIFWGPISSGRTEYKTPTGEFKILWKAREYRSKKYDVPMPLAINISYEGYFIHQQTLAGRPISHGCVRLLYADAKKLFTWSKIGDSVIIE